MGITNTLYYGDNRNIGTPPAGTTWKMYYGKVAVRAQSAAADNLYFLLRDHLGSVVKSIDAANGDVTILLYTAWGEARDSSGTMPTARQFTGQLQADAGLYFYQARFYDPGVMMFNQPDTLVPDLYNPLDWDRYAYARYNPIRYTDPTGHAVSDSTQGGCGLPGCIPVQPTTTTPKSPSTQNSNQKSTEKSTELISPTPITDFIHQLPFSSQDWATFATITDGLVLLTDLYAVGVVTYATGVGFASGLPVVVTGNIEVPAVTGGGAFLVADFFLVKPILTLGNYGASAATVFTFVSETKSGTTVIETGQISTVTKNSVTLTLVGWIAPEAISSTLIQSASFANDLGWISFPFH